MMLLIFLLKNMPLCKFRVNGRNNPWFTAELSNLLGGRDDAWAKARQSKSQSDWLVFKQLRNCFSSLVKKAKSQFYVDKTTRNLNYPKKFWRVTKSSFGDEMANDLPTCIVKDAQNITNKQLFLIASMNISFPQDPCLNHCIHRN